MIYDVLRMLAADVSASEIQKAVNNTRLILLPARHITFAVILFIMIKSFSCRDTEKLFNDKRVSRFSIF